MENSLSLHRTRLNELIARAVESFPAPVRSRIDPSRDLFEQIRDLPDHFRKQITLSPSVLIQEIEAMHDYGRMQARKRGDRIHDEIERAGRARTDERYASGPVLRAIR